jgi:hypothetical protein
LTRFAAAALLFEQEKRPFVEEQHCRRPPLLAVQSRRLV